MAFDSTECAWKDLSVFLNGKRVGKVKKLKYKVTRESEPLYGAGDDPFDINTGNKACEGELEAYKSLVDTMNDVARAEGFADLTDVPWVLVADYKPTATAPMRNDTLPGVRFGEFELGSENNNKSITVNMPFKSLLPIPG